MVSFLSVADSPVQPHALCDVKLAVCHCECTGAFGTVQTPARVEAASCLKMHHRAAASLLYSGLPQTEWRGTVRN